MTTPRDLDVLAEARRAHDDMRICAKCGWYALMNHRENCDPDRGLRAQRLIAAVPEVRSGQLGCGYGGVIFDLTDDLFVHFEVKSAPRTDHAFSLSAVFCLEALTTSEAADLVLAIKGWAEAVAAKRAEAAAGGNDE